MNPTEENIKVIVRIKPNNDKDKVFLTHNLETNCITIPGKDECVFDKVGDSSMTQEDVFENCKGLFQSFVDGYNATIFAYGQTGSGKTFTMTGDSDNVGNTRNPGLIPRGLSYIFDKVNERALTSGVEFLIKCSFVEIYNEQIYDLLDPQQQRLNLRFNITQEVYLEQCTEVVMDNPKDANKILQQGLLNRHIASTEMNRESSRSHAVFLIVLESREAQGEIDNIKKSCLYLVDLAGSERQRDSKAESLRLKEACMINKSLLSLSLVIRKLVESAKSNKTPYIAYRDSKLTLLLKDALGGNSKTALVACIHNDTRFMSDTYSTIHFASSVKMIRNKAKINVNIHGDNETLRKEVILLQEQLLKYKSPQLIQCHEFDYDLVWKKRFITAMALRSCLSLDVSTLNNQIVHTNNISLRLEKSIDNLKLERELNEKKIKKLEEQSENIVDDDFRRLLNNTLKTLNENTLKLDEQMQSDQLQIQVDYLQNELAKSKTLNMLAMSEKTLIHSLLNDYNNIIDSANIEKMLSKIEGQDVEMINLKQELSQTRYKNSMLKKKINNGNVARRDERRRLESEIASMKSNLKIVDEQREAAVVDRRRTLLSINDLHRPKISPIKGIASINCRRRTQKPREVFIKEDEENMQPLNEWLKKKDQETLSLDKISELEASLRIKQTEIGNMEYSINDYKKEVEELKSMLFSKERIEQKLKDMEEKYIKTEMALEESCEIINRLGKESALLESSKDTIIKKLTEQKYNLEEELRNAEEEIETRKDDLDRNNLTMVCLNDEIKRINEMLFSSQHECVVKVEEINMLNLQILSNNEEIAFVKQELSTIEKKLEATFNLNQNYLHKIEQLEKRNIDKEYSYNNKVQENEFVITELSDKIILLVKEIDDIKKENSLKQLNQSLQSILYLSPTCTSSPIRMKDEENSLNILVDDLMTSTNKVETELKSEQRRTEEITKIIQSIFAEFHLTPGDSLVENMVKIQAKLISYKHDFEDLVIKRMHLEESIKLRDEYCKTLSDALDSSRSQRDKMKKELDELINILPSGGHANHKQKIEYFTKYKEANASLKLENIKLLDERTKMRVWLAEKKCLEMFDIYNSSSKKKDNK